MGFVAVRSRGTIEKPRPVRVHVVLVLVPGQVVERGPVPDDQVPVRQALAVGEAATRSFGASTAPVAGLWVANRSQVLLRVT